MAKRRSDQHEDELTFDERWELAMFHRNGRRWWAYWERYADGEKWDLLPIFINGDYSEGDYAASGLDVILNAKEWADENGYSVAAAKWLDGVVEVRFARE